MIKYGVEPTDMPAKTAERQTDGDEGEKKKGKVTSKGGERRDGKTKCRR